MVRISNILKISAVIFSLTGCVYDFEPDTDKLEVMKERLVVIEGDILAGEFTSVRVGYSKPFYGETFPEGLFPGTSSYYDPEAGYSDIFKTTVWVESEDGRIWGGDQGNLGEFKIDTRGLDLTGVYRLCVSIPSRGEYVSEFRKVLVAPQIEKLSYSVQQDSTCVHLEVSTVGEDGETGYYRWTYEEAWANQPAIMPSITFSPQGVMSYMDNKEKERLQNCYRVAGSTDIIIANTEKLQQNIISENRIATIAATDRRISREYCITATQTRLDKEGYVYWEAMKKNTSETGGLFAPQPSEVRGNIKSTINPDEVVLGYINVSTASIKRLFVTAQEIGIYDNMSCTRAMTYYKKAFWEEAFKKYGMLPVSYLKNENGGDIMDEAHWAPKACVQPDMCNAKPEYWPAN